MQYNLLHERSMFIEPDNSTYEGFTDGGIWVDRKDFVKLPTWKNTARVLQIHTSCRDVKVNDLVIYKKHAPIELNGVEGDFFVLFEKQVLGVLRRGDGHVWFKS